MSTKIQVRRGTAAEWTAANPTLATGEIGFETDTGKVKIGPNPAVAWNSLLYITDVTDLTGTSLPTNIVNSFLTKIGPLSSGTAGVVHVDATGNLTSSTVTNSELAGSIAATKLIGTDIATVGTVTNGTWNGSVVAGQYGGTGVANTGKTITVSGNTSIGSSTNTVTLNTSGNTTVTLPTSGTVMAINHATLTTGTTAMAFGTNSSVIVTPNATATYTTTVPVAGTRCVLVILTSGTTSYVITLGSGFKPASTITTGTTTAKYWTVNFISDGTNLIEIGRSGPI